MTRKETTVVALKCFAIYLLSQIIIGFPPLITTIFQLNTYADEAGAFSNGWVIAAFAVGIIGGIAAFLLLWKSTNSLLTKETSDEDTGEIGVNGIMKIILACMGVYFLVLAAVHFPSALSYYRFSTQVPNPNPSALMGLVTNVLQLVFGCLLIGRPGRWVQAIRSIGDI